MDLPSESIGRLSYSCRRRICALERRDVPVGEGFECGVLFGVHCIGRVMEKQTHSQQS